MKVRGKKLFAAMLSLAMVLSLFTVPASAAGEGATVAAGTYYFGTNGHDGKKASADEIIQNTAGVAVTVTGIDFGNFTWHDSQHGLSGNGDLTIKIPANNYSTILVTTCTHGKGEPATAKINGGTSTTLTGKATSGNDGDGGNVYTIANATGDTVITFSGTTYIHGITVGAFSTTPAVLDPSLTLPQTAVDLKLEDTAASVTPVIENLSNPVVTVTSSKEAVATASYSNNAVEITPVAAGDASITVSVTGDGLSEALTETINVFVWDPAKPLTSWDFRIPAYLETSPANYRGLTLSGVSKHGSKYGSQATGGTYSIPVPGDCTITVSVGYNWDVYMPKAKDHNTAETSYKDNTNTGDKDVAFVYEGEAGNVTLATGSTFTSYVKSITVEASTTEPDPEEPDPVEPGNGKVDVWDFGAEQLDAEKFNNKLTADIINAWYPNTAAGTTGVSLPKTVTEDDLSITIGGNSGTPHRLRTTNAALTHADEKNLSKYDPSEDGDPYDPSRTRYTGVVESNGAFVVIDLEAGKGDKLTYALGEGSNKAYTATFTGADGKEKLGSVPTTHAALTFYAPKTGTQNLVCGESGIKAGVARIYRERPTAVEVSGDLTIDSTLADPTGLKLTFTNKDSGLATEATITGNTYTVALDNYQAGATYTVKASGITGAVVKAGQELTLGKDATSATHNITAGLVDLANVSGKVTGLDAASLARLKLTLTKPADKPYAPEIVLSGDDWSAKLEQGVEYGITAENVGDYTMGISTMKYSADATDNIVFTAKPVYDITIVPTGLDLDDLADAAFTFTNISETYIGADNKKASYTYTFTGTSGIQLRDGQYKVLVNSAGKGFQEPTADLVVDGADEDCPIGFDTDFPTEWNFRSSGNLMGAANGVAIQSGTGVCFGLEIDATTGKFDTLNRPDWAQFNTGTKISIPVNAADGTTVTLTINAYDPNVLTVDGKANEKSKSDEDFTCTVTNGAVEILSTANSYIGYIKLTAPTGVEFKDTVTVGKDKDCATIGAALELVKKMPRPNNERVTIVIDPGNYEEQLWVDVPNVTLKNANASTAKLELKNKGVDIGENEVRITHYYGHGYTYYSMTSNHRYDEKVLAANKASNHASFENLGSGNQKAGSYWNASVVVTADGFQAQGIIFENSFNQYISAKAANDVLEKQSGGKEGATPRAELKTVGDTTVQGKAYVERAAALAIEGTEAFFDNCAFIGRQDTLYGAENCKIGFYNCDVYGGTDYIMGGMNAVFAKCDLLFNTSDDSKDVGYVTAGQQASGGRGYLMYNCNVISTTPGVNTASNLPSKPGTFGRAWSTTSEVIFYETVIGTTTTKDDGTQGTEALSLIQPVGWTDTLNGGGHFERSGEYNTHESANVDNSASRYANANIFTEPKTADGAAMDYATWMGSWNPFEGKDMTLVTPATSRTVTFQVGAGASVNDLKVDDKAASLVNDTLTALKEAVITFKIGMDADYTLTDVSGATWVNDVYTVNADAKTVVISTSGNGSSGGSSDNVPTTAGKGSGKTETVTNSDGSKTTTKTDRQGNVTVTTKAPDGSQVVAYTSKDGDKTITVTDAKGNVQAKVELPATTPAPAEKFADVPAGHWAEESINRMAGLGTIQGVGGGSYDMDSPITRGSVATILYRLSNVTVDASKGTFGDVDAGDWYAEAVAWASGTGVVTGYSESVFAPKDSIDRQQLAVMLYRFAKLLRVDTTTEASLTQFQDSAAVADWAAEALSWCVGEGILKGNGAGLNPTGTATRAECATMLDRFIGLL